MTRKQRRLVIVHGIHTNDNAAWMSYLAARFKKAGWDAVVWTYGHAWAMLTYLQNPGRASKLADAIRPGDVLLTHSNGGDLAYRASNLGAPFAGWISLNPALDCCRVAAPHVRWVNLYPNRFDEAVKIAKLLPAHPWGAQGRDGLCVNDSRYAVTWTSNAVRVRRGLIAPAVKGHSAVLEPGALEAWSERFIADAELRA